MEREEERVCKYMPVKVSEVFGRQGVRNEMGVLVERYVCGGDV